MDQAKNDIIIYIGTFNEYNIYRIDEEKEKYSPFIKNFFKMSEYLKWKDGIHSSPLLREKYLAIINLKCNYKQFENTILNLQNSINPYVKTILIVEPREKFINEPLTPFEIIDLSKYHKEDFIRVLENELPQLTQDGQKRLIYKIGYSYSNLKLYLPELKKMDLISSSDISNLIKEVRLAPIEFILTGIVNKEQRYIREHYKLCEKYSESWVIRTYIKMLTDVLELKSKIKAGETTYSDIRSKKETRMYLKLIRDVNTSTIFLLRSFLEEYKNVGIEMFLISDRNKDRMELLEGGFSWNE